MSVSRKHFKHLKQAKSTLHQVALTAMCCPTLIPPSISSNSTTTADLVSLTDILALIDEATAELQDQVTAPTSELFTMPLDPILLRSDPRLVSSDDVKSAMCSSGQKKSHRSMRNGSSRSRREHHEHGTVHHSYHDYSKLTTEATDILVFPSKEAHSGTNVAFPVVLHRLLADATEEGFEKIVSWQPHGRAFLVHDHDRFVDEVMPNYFRQTRFSSFQRQLSLYGFLRLTKGPDSGAYYNEWFLRGLPHLCVHMQRTRVKGYGVRQSSSPDTEPDFYKMDAVSCHELQQDGQAEFLSNWSAPKTSTRQDLFQSINPLQLGNLEPIPATMDNTFEEQEAIVDFLSDIDLDDDDSLYLTQPYEGEDRFAKIYNQVVRVHQI